MWAYKYNVFFHTATYPSYKILDNSMAWSFKSDTYKLMDFIVHCSNRGMRAKKV